MESVLLRHAISPAHRNFSGTGRKIKIPEIFFRIRPLRPRTSIFHFALIRGKQSDFQDFQGYAKPLRLLPARELKVCSEDSLEGKLFMSLRDEGAIQCLYKVKLGTSNIYSSSLTDSNAGILLCLINKNGDSILQRISASLSANHYTESDDNTPHFQRGSTDEFIFEGPDLGRIEALWIGLESGQWRLGSLSLNTFLVDQTPYKEEGEEVDIPCDGFEYEFEVEDILLGEQSDISMVELRPCLVTKLYGFDPSTFSLKTESTLVSNQVVSNKESMKEYADLKFSLLLYDAILIAIGTSAASLSAGEKTALAFLSGGSLGFFYLLLLQRSVDGLPAPESISTNTREPEESFGGYKGPISILALAVGFTLFAVKYSSEDYAMVFSPRELIAGMMGFLVCKFAVLLAAFKPVQIRLKLNK